MILKGIRTMTVALGALLLGGSLVGPQIAFAGGSESSRGADYQAALRPVPHDPQADGGSNVRGTARLSRIDGRLTVRLQATGLTPGLPHAMHIHGELKARNECPPAAADINSEVTSTEPGIPDGLLSLGEGAPFYGPIQVSFTTTGDTSASSGLVLERFPVADADGNLSYHRTFQIPHKTAAKLKRLHIVVHGLDLDRDGAYSNLMEATLPVACGGISKG
jgi:hypothetical protein